VIHAVGPVWHGGGAGEEALLRKAYQASFEIARAHGRIRTMALPAISTGVYGYPRERACRIALKAMIDAEHDFERLVACLYDREHATMYTDVLKELT
jgi:O-acetyl-ADP-ribose deacetylase (regulator of RNase III)